MDSLGGPLILKYYGDVFMQIPLISLYWPSIIQIVDHKNDEPMHQPRISHILLPFQKKSSLRSDFIFKGSKI